MSYQAIARKWRPTRFEEIAGQGHVTRTLTNALKLKRIHHAFLFTGARGVGKTTAARTLARCLNCHQGPTPEPCGECPSCNDINHGASADVIEVDGASNNSVDDVRELRDAVRYLPSRDKYRVYIIDEVHMLSIGAFNALLKTLEEPPEHVVFIFATTEPQKIPDTILSRVQRFDFKRIPTNTVVGRLRTIVDAEGIGIPDDGLRLIARAGEGSMRDSQSLLDQVIAFGGDNVTTEQVAEILGLVDRSLLYGFLEGLVRNQPDLCLDSIAAVYDYGYELSQFTSELMELLRNAALMVLSPASRKHVDAPRDELGRLSELCQGVDAETFSRWFQVVLELHDQVARSSRPRLVLEMAVARLVVIRPLQPVDQLVKRLEGMERRLREQGVRPRPPGSGGPRGGGGGGSGGHVGSSRGPGGDPRGPMAAARHLESVQPVEPAQPLTPPPPEPPRVKPDLRLVPSQEESAPKRIDRFPKPADERFSAPPPEVHSAPEPESAEAPAATQAPPADAGVVLPDALPPEANEQFRFDRLLEWAKTQQVSFFRLSENTALLGVLAGRLRLVVPDEAARVRLQDVARGEDLMRAVRVVFPTVEQVDVLVRTSDHAARLTRREQRAKRLEEHRLALWEEAKVDPILNKVRDILGAELQDVVPLSDPEDLP